MNFIETNFFSCDQEVSRLRLYLKPIKDMWIFSSRHDVRQKILQLDFVIIKFIILNILIHT
jgi:hypothetical protein